MKQLVSTTVSEVGRLTDGIYCYGNLRQLGTLLKDGRDVQNFSRNICNERFSNIFPPLLMVTRVIKLIVLLRD